MKAIFIIYIYYIYLLISIVNKPVDLLQQIKQNKYTLINKSLTEVQWGEKGQNKSKPINKMWI